MKVLGAIIAGGRSSRMGAEKAFIMIDGITLIERVMSRIGFQVDEVAINANGDQARFAGYGCAVIADALPDPVTPLVGLHAALEYGLMKGFDAVVTMPVDAPFLPLDMVERFAEAGAVTGAVIARSGGRDHYLTGMWTTALAKPLERLIKTESLRRAQEFAARTKAEKVVWSAIPHDPFFNVNTPEDLALAETIVRAT